MQMNEKCLPCLVSQVVKIAQMSHAENHEALFRQVFRYMGEMDYTKSNPEIIGDVFALVKEHVQDPDPYHSIRADYNQLFMSQLDVIDRHIHSFLDAIKYAIIGNVIDFSPIHQDINRDIMTYFQDISQLDLAISHVDELKADIIKGTSLLYIGDNCGEICLDKLLLKRIKDINPQMSIYFATRGYPVVNDSIEEDAYLVGIDEYATIISNGDRSLGTVIPRTSHQFQDIYRQCDVIIAKGQANFESLSEENRNIYFLLMVKCDVISRYIGVLEKSLVCLSQKKRWKEI